jgi:hypothetical protein
MGLDVHFYLFQESFRVKEFRKPLASEYSVAASAPWHIESPKSLSMI